MQCWWFARAVSIEWTSNGFFQYSIMLGLRRWRLCLAADI